MNKYKVTYYKDDKTVEKEVEASGFSPIKDTGAMSVVFYEGGLPQEHTFVFYNVISVEKIN